GVVADAADGDAGLLGRLAADSVFDRLPRFDEAGKAGIHARGEAGLAAEETALAVDREHDHDRVGAREMFRTAGRAVAAVAADLDYGLGAADRQKAMPLMPAGEAPRLRQRAEMLVRERTFDRQR